MSHAPNVLRNKTIASAKHELREQTESSRSSSSSNAVSSKNNYRRPGDIDLNSAMLNLQIKRDKKGIPLPVFQQPIDSINIEGFFPMIINITPINVLLLLTDFDPKENKNTNKHDYYAYLIRKNGVLTRVGGTLTKYI